MSSADPLRSDERVPLQTTIRQGDREGPAPTGLPSSSATAPPATPSASDAGPRRFAFDFQDAELPELVRAVSMITGKRILVTGQLPKVKATVHSPEPVTAVEAYQAFLTILQTNGLTLERRGRMEVIVPAGSLVGR